MGTAWRAASTFGQPSATFLTLHSVRNGSGLNLSSPPIDAIEEFNIQKSLYSSEYGGKASATISAITKSGANAFHGDLYEFVRNDVFDARNFFDPSRKPPYQQNQFGVTLGGPLHKDGTFFFLRVVTKMPG